MSSRFSTRRVQPVGLVVDGVDEDPGLVRAELELVGEQAGRRRLDRGQRGAKVVAHRGEQRRAQLVGPGQGVGLGRLGVQAVAFQRGGQLGGEPGQDLSVLGGQARAPEGENLPLGEGSTTVASSGAAGGSDRCDARSTIRWSGSGRSLGPSPPPVVVASDRSTAAASSRKATSSSSSSAGRGLPSGATIRPATRANIWASDRAGPPRPSAGPRGPPAG